MRGVIGCSRVTQRVALAPLARVRTAGHGAPPDTPPHAASCAPCNGHKVRRTLVRHIAGAGLASPRVSTDRSACAIGGMYTFAKASGPNPQVNRQANSRARMSAVKLTCESQRPSRSDNTSHTCTAPVHTVAPASTCPPVPITDTDAPLKTTSSGSQVQIAAKLQILVANRLEQQRSVAKSLQPPARQHTRVCCGARVAVWCVTVRRHTLSRHVSCSCMFWAVFWSG